MRRLACWYSGHRNVRVMGLMPYLPDEIICLRCFKRATIPLYVGAVRTTDRLIGQP